MPDKDGADEKKSTKDVVNKKQKQLLNQEQLDLSSVAESFGGQIVEEPVELDEFAISGTAAAYYGIPALVTAIGAYGTARQMQGKQVLPSIKIPNLGIKDKAKKVFGKIKKVLQPNVERTKKNKNIRKKIEDLSNQNPEQRNKTIDDLLNTNRSKNVNKKKTKINPNVDKSFSDALKNNRKNLKPPEVKGDPLKTGDGSTTTTTTTTSTQTQKNTNFNNKNNKKIINNKNKNVNKNKNRNLALATTAGGVGTTLGVSTLMKGKGKGRGRGFPKFPDPSHRVGSRSNPQ